MHPGPTGVLVPPAPAAPARRRDRAAPSARARWIAGTSPGQLWPPRPARRRRPKRGGAKRRGRAPPGPRPPWHTVAWDPPANISRSEEHTSELQSLRHLVCRLLLEKKKKQTSYIALGLKSSRHHQLCLKSGRI